MAEKSVKVHAVFRKKDRHNQREFVVYEGYSYSIDRNLIFVYDANGELFGLVNLKEVLYVSINIQW